MFGLLTFNRYLHAWFEVSERINKKDKEFKPILSQCSISSPLENIRTSKRFLSSKSIEMEHWDEMGCFEMPKRSEKIWFTCNLILYKVIDLKLFFWMRT